VQRLRDLHPEAKILVHKNVSFVAREKPGCSWAPYQAGGVGWCEADSHESWFLHGGDGQRLTASDYAQNYAMNIGNTAYQQAWLDDVLARLRDVNDDGKGVRYDGVFMDDTNLTPGHGLNGRMQELTDAQYREATVNFIHAVAPQIRQAGFIAMPNVALDPTSPSQRDAAIGIAHDVTAIDREGFVRWYDSSTATGPLFTDPVGDGGRDWLVELKLMEDVQAAGAGYNAIVYGSPSDIEPQRYARATFLLGWDGRSPSAVDFRTDGSAPTYLPDWTTDVGTPTGARFAVGVGWRRNFTGGTVVLNASPTAAQAFPLGGKYQTPGGGCTASVSLAPAHALVLPSC
jgi:hypothetical protein